MTSNRLASVAATGQPTRTFTSDNAGNITLDDRGAGNTVTIAIGADGRPQTVAVAGAGATSVAYKHNALGERVSRVESATTTHFHYDRDGTLIAESDGAGVVIREYLWLGTKPLSLVVGPAGSSTLYFVHADHLDRVQMITDGSMALAWDGQFTPYGRTHAIAGTVANPLRFPGQWADPAAGYFYNYMRDYDPTLARYLSVDPFGTGGGRNKFGYVDANPQNFVDPRGEELRLPTTLSGSIGSYPAQVQSLTNQIRQFLPNYRYATMNGLNPNMSVSPYSTRYTEADVAHLSRLLNFLRFSQSSPTTPSQLSQQIRQNACAYFPREGVYILPPFGRELPYIGQSQEIPQRLQRHLTDRNLRPDDLYRVFSQEVSGGRTQRELQEQMIINQFRGIGNLRNERNPIGPRRQHLLPSGR